jgi:hypothetical protein
LNKQQFTNEDIHQLNLQTDGTKLCPNYVPALT